MRFMNPVSCRIVVASAAILGTVLWAFVAAETSAAGDVEQKIEKKDKLAQKEKTERGRFVSFKDGTLRIQANSGALLANKLPENTKTLVWDHEKGVYKPASTAEALNQVKSGTWFMVHVANESATVRIGSRKGETIGTFVSFKNDRLLIIGKNLGESFVKKYGDNVHFNKFRDDVPIYESVDGGAYKLIGVANKVLGTVKEGTILTVHGEGDDNITLVQIGVPTKPASAQEKKANDKVEKKSEQKDKVAPKAKTVTGWFDSFADGVLTVKYRNGLVQDQVQIPDNARTFVWNHNEGRYQPVQTAEAMSQLKTLTAPVDPSNANTAEAMMWRKAGVGLVVQVAEENVTIRIGEKKTPFIGKFVAFKSDVLVFRLTDRTGPYRSLYGNPLQFKMREDIPVYETIDGGEYKWVGTPRSALGNVREGANITIYHHYKTEDDEFYLILVGANGKSAEAPAKTATADKAEQKIEKKAKVVQKQRIDKGRFVSFKAGTLTLKANFGDLVENNLPDNAKTLIWNEGKRNYIPIVTAEALNQVKPGTWIEVVTENGNPTIRIDAGMRYITGTFVSFKNDRLSVIGKNLSPNSVKLYGDLVHFNMFAEHVPVHESVDGGAYKLIGTANKVLGSLREGMIVTVHGQADYDNVILIQIGVPKKN